MNNISKIEILYTITMTPDQKIKVFGNNQYQTAKKLDELVTQHYVSGGESPYIIPHYIPCVVLENDKNVVLVLFNCVRGFPVFLGDPDFVGFNSCFLPIREDDDFISNGEELTSDINIRRAIKEFTPPDWYYETDID